MSSTNEMLRQTAGLVDTKDVNSWENDFLKSVWEKSREGSRPDLLSPRQVEALEKIWRKHCGG